MMRWLMLPFLLIWAGAGEKKADGLDGTLWVQTSAEYTFATRQVYRAASSRLEALLADKSLSAVLEQQGDFSMLPPAVVMDVDETVLDNSAFQARMLVDGVSFSPEMWAGWVARTEAEEVPGALAFVIEARALGIAVIYVTNSQFEKIGVPRRERGVGAVEARTPGLGFREIVASRLPGQALSHPDAGRR